MTGFIRRLRARFRNRWFDDELAEELRVHEEMKREELEASGMSAHDSRASARRALGNVTLMREDARRVWIGRWLEVLIQDARYAVRSLSRQPLHSLTVIAVLVLAIGMNTSLFAFLRATTFAPWPAVEADRVVRIWARVGSQYVGPSVDEYRFVRDNATTLKGAAAYFPGAGARLQATGRTETYPRLMLVSSHFLDVMGTRCSAAPDSSRRTINQACGARQQSSAIACGAPTSMPMPTSSARPSSSTRHRSRSLA